MQLFKERKKTTTRVRRTPPSDIGDLVKQGKKFIPVEKDFDERYVPDGYCKLNMKYRGESFIALVPEHIVGIIGNQGEGDSNEALDTLADFYSEINEFEDELILTGSTNICEVDIATETKENYNIHLRNALSAPKTDDDGYVDLDTPIWNEELLHKLDLNDPYVQQRTKAIAAIMLGKDASELDATELSEVVEHKTVRRHHEARMTAQDLKEKVCYGASHYDLKPELHPRWEGNHRVGNDGEFIYRLSEGGRSGKKIKSEIKRPVLDKKVQQLQTEIEEYRKDKHRNVGRHDLALIQQYINLAYIAKDNANAQMNIEPAKNG